MPKIKNRKLADQINALAKRDQLMRNKAKKTGVWDQTVDKKNADNLRNIIAKYGWPTVGLVGKKASYNAWLIVQHATHDLNFQKKCLTMMTKVLEENPKAINKLNIVYLTDRLMVYEKGKQFFGTQLYINKRGKRVLRPVIKPATLDNRRKEYGLEPIDKYVARVRRLNKNNAKIKKVIK